MATVKVKLRPSSVQGKAGTIFYQITHRRVIRQITTSIHIRLECWDDYNQRIIAQDDKKLIQLQNRIDCDVSLLYAIIKKLESSGIAYSINDIVHQFKTLNSHINFIDFMREQIDYLRRCNQHGTAKNYERAMCSFAEFLNGDIAIIAFNEQLVEDYNAFLSQRGIVRNSISFYMRILRSVYNKAVRRHIVEQTNPFQNVYTGIDKTKKRAVDESVISKLCKLDLSIDSHLELTRDTFVFSYCVRGMAFVDIAFLKKRNIKDDTLTYSRHKTGQLLSIKVEPCMKKIIDKYVALTNDAAYVFLFLSSTESKEAYNQYRKAINLIIGS